MCELGATHMNTETKIKYQRYDEAFKRSAVEHWMVSGKSATQVADELGINSQNLHKWKAKFKTGKLQRNSPMKSPLLPRLTG